MKPYLVPYDFNYVRCAHPSRIPQAVLLHEGIIMQDYPDMGIANVEMHWQLQRDGSEIKIGKCAFCGQVYVTGEER